MDYGAALEMRFGATRRGFESRPLRHRSRPAGLAALAISLGLVAGCGSAGAAPTERPTVPAPAPAAASSAGDSRAVAATVFGFLLDSLEPAARTAVLDEFASAIGHRLDGLPASAAETQLVLLASNGTFRLDDATLLRRLDLEAAAKLGVDVPLCAELARGQLQLGSMSPALAGLMTPLTPAERLEEARILVAAVRAEVSGTGTPLRFPADQTPALVKTVLMTFEPTESVRLATLAADVASGRASSDGDVCEVSRIPYRAAARLSPADRLRLARYILGT